MTDYRKRLEDLAVGWETGAEVERVIVAHYQPMIDAFLANDTTAEKMRFVRAALDARSNAERFEKDAAALRQLLSEGERMWEALERLRDCDWVITPLDRMDAVRDIARQAIGDPEQ